MTQINYTEHNRTSGGKVISVEKEYFGTEAGSYSFVIPPRSISTFKCLYVLNTAQVTELSDKHFDNLKIRYFDERDKAKVFNARAIFNTEVTQDADDDWTLLK